MIRPIKFRAWSEDVALGNHMIEWEDLKKNSYEQWEEWRYELMQFTGFKDKNDREIYEGDILLYRTGRDNTLRRKVVEWRHIKGSTGFNISEFGSARDGGGGKTLTTNREIIGNIYENPDLVV